MKYRVIKHTRNSDDKQWFTAQYRKFFLWFTVPGFVEGNQYNITFSTEQAAWEYLEWYFKDETISKSIIY